MNLKRYREILKEFEETGLPFEGTHSLMNYVSSAHPDEYSGFETLYIILDNMNMCQKRIDEIDEQIVSGISEFETEAECKAYIQGIEYALATLFPDEEEL